MRPHALRAGVVLALCIALAIPVANLVDKRGQSSTSLPGAMLVVKKSTLLYPVPAAPAPPSPCPPPYVPPGPPAPPLPAPAVATTALPTPATVAKRHVNLDAVTGKGMWITDFPGDSVAVAQDIALAKKSDLQQLWIRTGSTHDGFYAAATLRALVPAARAAHLSVIAWDFPTMSNPAVDAARAQAAFALGVSAFSPDIETSAEGTYLGARRVAYYLSLVRKVAGNRPVIAIVPRPTSLKPSAYPYIAEAPYIDVFAPMVYWSCTEPGAAVAMAIRVLGNLRPTAPIGQDYDMASEGGRHGLPSGQEIWRFLNVAQRDGAIGASLYDLEAGGSVQLATIAAYPWQGLTTTK